MKKVLFMLMLMVGTTTAITSCKKETKKSAKEQNLEYLQSGKWYIQQRGDNTCFDADDFLEFKKDGTVGGVEGAPTYSLSEDGKTLTVGDLPVIITEIGNTKLVLNIDGSVYQLAKTAKNCTK